MAQAKKKGPKPTNKPTTTRNKHIHARIAYLYRASHYLALRHLQPKNTPTDQTLRSIPTLDTASDPVALHASNPSPQSPTPAPTQPATGPSVRLLSHLRAISLKSRVQLPRAVKRSICKRCDAPLIAGATSRSYVENRSRRRRRRRRGGAAKGHGGPELVDGTGGVGDEGLKSGGDVDAAREEGRKPWADVLKVECGTCGETKRFPVGASLIEKNLKREQRGTQEATQAASVKS